MYELDDLLQARTALQEHLPPATRQTVRITEEPAVGLTVQLRDYQEAATVADRLFREARRYNHSGKHGYERHQWVGEWGGVRVAVCAATFHEVGAPT